MGFFPSVCDKRCLNVPPPPPFWSEASRLQLLRSAVVCVSFINSSRGGFSEELIPIRWHARSSGEHQNHMPASKRFLSHRAGMMGPPVGAAAIFIVSPSAGGSLAPSRRSVSPVGAAGSPRQRGFSYSRRRSPECDVQRNAAVMPDYTRASCESRVHRGNVGWNYRSDVS